MEEEEEVSGGPDPSPIVEVGTFFVEKSGKMQLRLVLDARISNLHFEAPWSVGLAAGGALAGIKRATVHVSEA